MLALYLGQTHDQGSSPPCPDIQGHHLTLGREHISAQMMNYSCAKGCWCPKLQSKKGRGDPRQRGQGCRDAPSPPGKESWGCFSAEESPQFPALSSRISFTVSLGPPSPGHLTPFPVSKIL